MEAKEGQGGSYAWSILIGREVIRKGAKWRVGNGESIKLWGDRWLPSLSNASLQGPLVADLQEATVSCLINPATRSWDSSTLSRVLSHDEARQVQNIQLSRQPCDDTLFWPYVQFGNYSAKSGYFFLKTEAQMSAPPRNQAPLHTKNLWKSIWQLAVPCKVRNFIWRACRNAIPTNSNLVRRCVVADSTCPLCSQTPEDVLHSLWSCSGLNQVWEDDPQWAFRSNTRFQSFPQVFLHVLQSDCSANLFAMLAWNIWFRRDKARMSPPGWPLDQISQQAYQSLLEFRSAQPRKPNAATSVLVRWQPPPLDQVKINFDGAIFKNEDRAGIGVIVRDSQGMVMASLSQNIPLPHSIVNLETLAACRALEFTLELGFDKAILEGDSMTVMAALGDPSPSLASYGLLVRDAQLLACSFTCISFQHVGRVGNNVAHNLARHSRHVTGYSVWMEDVPIQIFTAYQADLPIIQ